MAFVPENDLEKALMRAATEPAARPDFCRQLLACDLYVIGAPDTPHDPGAMRLANGEKLHLVSVEKDGRKYLPVFSSLGRLTASVSGQQGYIALKGRDLFEMTRGSHFVLNPGADYGKELPAGEIAMLLDPGKPQTVRIEAPTKVLIGQPAVYPHTLVNTLKACFAKHKDVVSAHLVQIAFPDGAQPPHPMIGVAMTGDWDSLAAEIGRVAKIAAPGITFDMMRIEPGKAGDIAAALAKTPPFYQRKKSLWRALFN
jgi:hypothetical protein